MRLVLLLIILATASDCCLGQSAKKVKGPPCGNYAACPENWACEDVVQNTCRTSLVCTPTCVTDDKADRDLQECVEARKKKCEQCENVKEQQCLVLPVTDCKTVNEEHCTTKDGKKCVRGPPPECTVQISRNCTMVLADTCKLPKKQKGCMDNVETSCTTETEPFCRKVEVPDCTEKVCTLVRKIDENCRLQQNGETCKPTVVEECKLVEGTKCEGFKNVTKCTDAIVTRCEEVTIPCGDQAAVADCELEEANCTDVDVEVCEEDEETQCDDTATKCVPKRVRRCTTVKEESCSDVAVRKCTPNLEKCKVPECKGPEPVECNDSTCAVGERCSPICERQVISDHPEECKVEETQGCVRKSGL